jgi:hypothetical protein
VPPASGLHRSHQPFLYGFFASDYYDCERPKSTSKQGDASLADHQDVVPKVSEALNAAAQCSAAETVENYSALNEQLWELNSLLGRSLQAHTGYQPLVTKLQNGTALTADELKTLRSLIVGDADQYLKYDDDFERTKSELGRILDQIRRLNSNDPDLEALMHLRVLCREASSALAPTMHYLEQKERVQRFEEHTRGPLDRDAGHVLAGIIKNMMG